MALPAFKGLKPLLKYGGTSLAELASDAAVDVLKGFPPTASAASLRWQDKKTRGPVFHFRNAGPPSFAGWSQAQRSAQ